MYTVFGLILLILVIVNIFFHCAGIYLLTVIKRNGKGKIHLINLLNLSCIELSSSLLSLLTIVFHAIKFTDQGVSKEIENHINMIKASLILTAYFLTMVVILMDKVLEVLMNIRYAVIWNVRKANILIMIMWVFGTALCLSFLIAYQITKFDFMYYFPTFIMLPANIFYIILALASYAYIFYKFNKSRILPYGGRKDNAKTLSFFHVFRKSRFFIPTSLILVYIMFHVIPTIVYILSRGMKERKYIRMYIAISYNIAMLFDSWICIFLEPNVKQLLRRIIKTRRDRIDIKRNRTQCKTTSKTNIIHPETNPDQDKPFVINRTQVKDIETFGSTRKVIPKNQGQRRYSEPNRSACKDIDTNRSQSII